MYQELFRRAALHSLVVAAASTALLFTLLAGGDNAAVHAQTAGTPTAEATSEATPEATPRQGEGSGAQNLPPLESKLNPPKYPNMDSNLNRIVEQAQAGRFSAQATAASAPLHKEESVAVTLYISEGYVDAIAAYLESNGASPRNIGIDYIEAYIPVSLLPAASEQEGVISIRTIVPPQPAQGAIVSEGAAAHGAPAWHDAGFKAQGVKIGIIDTGFEGFQSLMGTELPATVEARCYTYSVALSPNLLDCEVADDRHGTAVTEALFDIAPDATYYIANPLTEGDLQTAVEWMVAQDVDVINMSVGWSWDGPGDGTSPYSDSPLRAVDTAVASGIAWVNGAGNEAQDVWFGPYEDTDGDGDHNFGVNIDCNTIELQMGKPVDIILRWDDNWAGASRDLDLYLIRPDANGDYFFANAFSSENEQSGRPADYPLEEVSVTDIPYDMTACIVVSQYRGAPPSWMQLQSFRNQDLEFHTLSGSINNPAESANPGLLAVGAAPWYDTSTIESFSSRGPTPDGRTKPDIVGADMGDSAIWGPWDGTSASSAHVAGLAALVKQRFPE